MSRFDDHDALTFHELPKGGGFKDLADLRGSLRPHEDFLAQYLTTIAPDNRLYIVAAMHSVATRWAQSCGLTKDQYVTATHARTLRGLPDTTEVIVLDSRFKFEDSHGIHELAKRFGNLHRISV